MGTIYGMNMDGPCHPSFGHAVQTRHLKNLEKFKMKPITIIVLCLVKFHEE